MPEQQNIEALKQAIANFNAGNLEGYLDVFDRAVVVHGLARGLKPGIGGLRDYYSQLRAAFPDARLASEDLIADGEKLAERYTFYGTHRGEYLGVAPTRKLVMSPGTVVHHFRGGKIIESWHSGDSLKFLSQIGALPALALKR